MELDLPTPPKGYTFNLYVQGTNLIISFIEDATGQESQAGKQSVGMAADPSVFPGQVTAQAKVAVDQLNRTLAQQRVLDENKAKVESWLSANGF